MAFDGSGLRVGELQECKGEPNWVCIQDERDYSGIRFRADPDGQEDLNSWQIRFELCNSPPLSQEESASSEVNMFGQIISSIFLEKEIP